MGAASSQPLNSSQASVPSDWSADNKVSLYGTIFEFWTKTRDERADYNKYFISLLFIDAIVAILSATFWVSKETKITNLTVVLLIATFIGGFVISLVWWLKLSTLRLLADLQLGVLADMEDSFNLPSHPIQEFKARMDAKINKSVKGTFKNRVMIDLNYSFLPKFFAAFYIVLIIVTVALGKILFEAI